MGLSDGANPYFATLIQRLAGPRCGTTSSGGGNNAGAAFSISFTAPVPLTNLYGFIDR